MQKLAKELRAQLKKAAKTAYAASAQRFFKEPINVHGVKSAESHKIIKNFYDKNLKDKTKQQVFELCELLWKDGYLEETSAAATFAHARKEEFKPADFKTFENWIKNYVTNWASCDVFCNHVVGDFLMAHPGYLKKLKTWAKSKNLWMRRAAAVSLIIPVASDKFIDEALDISKTLLTDGEDMVQKGYGWLLKSASEAGRWGKKRVKGFESKQLPRIHAFVMKHKDTMPRTALRYAIEKMPPALKKQAMAKPAIKKLLAKKPAAKKTKAKK